MTNLTSLNPLIPLTSYVSDADDTKKRDSVNNVIKSLSCFITETTNDKTCQDYGYICYTGPIQVGQVIHGTKKPKRGGIPVVTNGLYIGSIDEKGDLLVTNTTQVRNGYTSSTVYTGIQYTLYEHQSYGDVGYECTACEPESETCCYNEDGWDVVKTCTSQKWEINENCKWYRAYVPTDYCEWSQHEEDHCVRTNYSSYYFETEVVSEEQCKTHLAYYYECMDGVIRPACYKPTWCGCSCYLTEFCDGRTCIISDIPPTKVYDGDTSHNISPSVDTVTLTMCSTKCEINCYYKCTKKIDCINLEQIYV